MPLTLTKKAAKSAHQRVLKACEEVRNGWTVRDRLIRRDAAEQMQGRLAQTLGLALQPVRVRAPR